MDKNVALFALLSLAVSCFASDQAFVHGTVQREGFRLHYRVYGTGAPVVMLAGGPGADCDYLEPVARELGKTNRAILVELRGTGRSLPPAINRETIKLKLYLADLEALRTQLKFQRWTLFGHSAGGLLVMEYTAAYPNRVRSLVLADSQPIAGESKCNSFRNNIKMRLTPEERSALDKATASRDYDTASRLMTPGYFYDRAKGLAAAAASRPDSSHPEISRLLAQDASHDVRPLLKNFAGPVLVIAGRQDPFDPACQHAIGSAFKKFEVKLIDRCGHRPWVEQPEEFYHVLRDFLARARLQ